MRQLRHLDLCSGVGGFSLAAESLGWKTIAFCEIDPAASLVLKHWWPDVPNLKDMRKLCRRAYDCESNHDDFECYCPRRDTEFGGCDCIGTDQFLDTYGEVDLLTAGVPCQPASTLGKMRGTTDERWLWPEVIRIMCELRPRICVYENPAALLTLERGTAFNGIVSGMVEIGYDLLWDVFPAEAFGAGHKRERLFIIAIHSDTASIAERIAPDQSDTEPGIRNARRITSSGDESETTSNADSERREGERLLLRPAPGTGAGAETGIVTDTTGREINIVETGDVADSERRGQSVGAAAGTGGAVAGTGASEGAGAITYAGGSRLEGYAGDGDGSGKERGCGTEPRRPVAPPDLRGRVKDFGNGLPWFHEANTGIPVLADGLSSRLVEAAARCAGNAVVPAVAQAILAAIMEMEKRNQ